jgi:mannosyltransferase
MLPRTLLACALLATAFAARTYRLFDRSIWADDVWSIAAATGHSLDVRLDGMTADETYADPPGIAPAADYLKYIQPQPGNNLWRVARDTFAQESHPPLFYLLLHVWMSWFGYTVAAGRAFSLLFGLAAIPVLFFFAKRLAGETAAWIAALLCAMAPFQTLLALQVRGYTLTSFLVLVTAWLTFEILERRPSPDRGSGQVQALIWLGVTGMMTHYYFVIYSALEGLALLTQRRLLRVAVWVGVVWTAVLGLLVWYFLVQPSSLAQPWMRNPWYGPLLLLNAGSALTDLLIFSPNESLSVFLAAYPLLITAIKLLLVVVVGASLLLAARHLPSRHAIFLLVWFVGPVMLIFVLDMVRRSGTVMTPRYFAGSAFPLYVLLAVGLANLKPLARTAGAAFLVLLMLECHMAVRELPVGVLSEGYDAQRAAIAVESRWQPRDVVIVLSNYGCVPVSMAYYLPPQTPMLSLVYLPRKEQGPVVAPATLDSLQPRVEKEAGGRPHLWVMRSYPDSVTSQKLDDWLLPRYRTVHNQRYGALLLSEMESKQSP